MRRHLTSRPRRFHPSWVLGPLGVNTTASGLNVSSIPLGASGALIANVSGGAVNYLIGGTDPTTAVGIPLAVGEYIEIRDERESLETIRFIRNSGTADGSLTFLFFTEP